MNKLCFSILEQKNRNTRFRFLLLTYAQKNDIICKCNMSYRGVAQLVAREVWDFDAVGSNPATPTKKRGFDRMKAAKLGYFAAFYHIKKGLCNDYFKTRQS